MRGLSRGATRHTIAPDIVSGYPLNPQREWMSIVVPEGTTNLFRNPSWETGTGRWTQTSDGAGAAYTRSAEAQCRGVYCARLTIGTGGTFNQLVGRSVTIGVQYAISFHVRRPNREPVSLTNLRAAVNNTTVAFTDIAYIAGGWWRVSLVFVATATNSVGIRILDTPGSIWYVDAAQLEEKAFMTTYCDGDEAGLMPGEQAFRWNGAAHDSTSTRSATTGAGGRIVALALFGATILALMGLGAPTVNNVITPLGLIDGGLYQRSIRPERSFSVALQFDTPDRDPSLMSKRRGALRAILAHDRVGDPQPVRLLFQRYEGKVAVGDQVASDVLYAGGLEEATDNLYGERVAVQFTQYLPLLAGGADVGTVLDTREEPTIAYVAIRNRETGTWSGLASLDALPLALVFGPDRHLYAGGNFTTPGTRVAAYNFDTAAWETLSTGLAQQVNALAFAPNGILYAGLNAAVTIGPNTGSVVQWDGATWSVPAAGNSDVVQALAYDPTRDRLYATGATAGNTTLRYLNAGAWTTVTSGTGGGTGNALAYSQARDRLYVGGSFTNLTGVGTYDAIVQYTGTAFAEMAGGANNTVHALSLDPDNQLYAAGIFSTIGGVSATGFATWNGQVWDALTGLTGTGVVTAPRVAFDPVQRELWGAGAVIGQVPGSFIPVAIWRDDNVLQLPGALFVVDTNRVSAIAHGENANAVAYNVSGTYPTAGRTVVTNSGTIPVSPTIRMQGVTAAGVTVYQIINWTTGKQLAFKLTVYIGEVITLDLTPGQVQMISSARGDITSLVLPSSDFDFVLAPGPNEIYAFTTDPATFPVTITMSYTPGYLSLDDATLAPEVLP